MQLPIELAQELDGRWIAEVPQIPGVMAYGRTREEAIERVQTLAQRVVADQRPQALLSLPIVNATAGALASLFWTIAEGRIFPLVGEELSFAAASTVGLAAVGFLAGWLVQRSAIMPVVVFFLSPFAGLCAILGAMYVADSYFEPINAKYGMNAGIVGLTGGFCVGLVAAVLGVSRRIAIANTTPPATPETPPPAAPPGPASPPAS